MLSGKRFGVAAGLLLALAVQGLAQAQESVNQALDECISTERLKAVGKGAVVGAFLGLLKAKLDRNGSSNQDIAVGAIAGGLAGVAYAHFHAVASCYRKNPSWMPESNIVRSGSYAALRQRLRYRPAEGVVARVLNVAVAAEVRPGTPMELVSRFGVLTPNGAEADAVIERKLFAVDAGKETELPIVRAREERRVEAGESVDRVVVPIPADMSPGIAFRYEFSVAVPGRPAATQSVTTTVQL